MPIPPVVDAWDDPAERTAGAPARYEAVPVSMTRWCMRCGVRLQISSHHNKAWLTCPNCYRTWQAWVEDVRPLEEYATRFENLNERSRVIQEEGAHRAC